HRDFHLSLANQTEHVAALVGVKDHVVFRIAPRLGHGGDCGELAVVEVRKERELPKERRLHGRKSIVMVFSGPPWPSSGSSPFRRGRAAWARRRLRSTSGLRCPVTQR